MSSPRTTVSFAVILAVSSVSTMALGQNGRVADTVGVSFDCPADDCHVAPFFRGTGGFVGRAAHEDDPATTDIDESRVWFFVLCGSASASSSVAPDSRGIVRQELTAEKGFGCAAEAGGKLEIRGLDVGGWYWINDDVNSAVANLIAKEVADQRSGGALNRHGPTDPGGVTFQVAEGGAATLVKHEASGRIGILPHLLPQPPVRICGLRNPNGPDARQVAADCRVDAVFSLGVTTLDSLGRTVHVGSTVRRGVTATVTLTANVYGSGHISMSGDPELGAVADKALAADWELELHSTDPQLTLAGFGVAQDVTNPNEVLVAPASYCDDPEERNYSASIRIRATRPGGGNAIVPDIPEAPEGLARVISIACPPPAAPQGRNLIPANPFPPAND